LSAPLDAFSLLVALPIYRLRNLRRSIARAEPGCVPGVPAAARIHARYSRCRVASRDACDLRHRVVDEGRGHRLRRLLADHDEHRTEEHTSELQSREKLVR